MSLLKIKVGGTTKLVKYEALPGQYKKVRYIQSNGSNNSLTVNYNNPLFSGDDVFSVEMYIKTLADNSNEVFTMSTGSNGTGYTSLYFRLWPAYYPGQCQYVFSGKGFSSEKIYLYNTGNPLPREQVLLFTGQNVYINDTLFMNNLGRTSNVVGSIRFLAYTQDAALGKVEVYGSDMKLKEKLVPCLDKTANSYGLYSTATKTFFGRNTFSEFVPPQE